MTEGTVNAALELSAEKARGYAVAATTADRGQQGSLYPRCGKRLLDIVVASVLLIATAPLVAMLALLICSDGGPAFYAQTRIGRGGRRFRCLKLRSMVPDADARLARLRMSDPQLRREWEEFQKLSRDPRVTPLGRVLRATSLDELPQLINVLRGEMSLVGPRPFTPEQEAAYRLAGGRAYFDHRPGLTGPWQVSERARGGFAGRIAHDERYLAQVTLAKDLWLIARTFGAVLRCTGQ